MRVLTGYLPPTSGTVEIGGFDIIEHSLEARRLIGYMPETVPLYPDMTVFEYLMFMADLRHLKDAEDRVDDVLEMVHMEDRSEGTWATFQRDAQRWAWRRRCYTVPSAHSG